MAKYTSILECVSEQTPFALVRARVSVDKDGKRTETILGRRPLTLTDENSIWAVCLASNYSIHAINGMDKLEKELALAFEASPNWVEEECFIAFYRNNKAVAAHGARALKERRELIAGMKVLQALVAKLEKISPLIGAITSKTATTSPAGPSTGKALAAVEEFDEPPASEPPASEPPASEPDTQK